MKQLWIGLIVVGALAACRNGPNNARDTTGMGSQGTAGGLLPGDTTGRSAGAATSPAPMTSDTTKRDTTKRDTTKRDTTQSAATKHHKKSHKHP